MNNKMAIIFTAAKVLSIFVTRPAPNKFITVIAIIIVIDKSGNDRYGNHDLIKMDAAIASLDIAKISPVQYTQPTKKPRKGP